MRFHHIGYAVANIEEYLNEFLIPMFSPIAVSPSIEDPIQRVTVCFAEMHGGAVIELVEPLGDKSPVTAYLGSNRGGLYHLCYEVDDLDETIIQFRSKGCLPLSRPVPATAFEGRKIVFLLTPDRGLIELLESDSGNVDA